MATLPPDLSAAISALFTAVRVLQDANYATAAAITFLLCDIGATLLDEIQFIWKQRWRFPKFLYLFARYYGLMYLVITLSVQSNTKLSLGFCRGYYRFFSLGGEIFFTTVVNAIFILRIHALFERSKKVLVFFIVLCLIEFGAEFYVTWQSNEATHNNVFPPPIAGWPGCATLPAPPLRTLISWLPCIVVAFIFFAFTIYKFLESTKDESGQIRLNFFRDTQFMSPILVVLVRDGAIFFLLIFVILVINCALTIYKDGMFAPASLPWLIAIYSFTGSHLVLNLRNVDAQGVAGHIESQSMPMSTLHDDLRFANRDQLTGNETLVSATHLEDTLFATRSGFKSSKV